MLKKRAGYVNTQAAWTHPNFLQNKTNGVTQRRWLAFCNPPLRDLITAKLGSDVWIRDLYKLKALGQHADDPAFQEEWHKVKLQAKLRTAALVLRLTGKCRGGRQVKYIVPRRPEGLCLDLTLLFTVLLCSMHRNK